MHTNMTKFNNGHQSSPKVTKGHQRSPKITKGKTKYIFPYFIDQLKLNLACKYVLYTQMSQNSKVDSKGH